MRRIATCRITAAVARHRDFNTCAGCLTARVQSRRVAFRSAQRFTSVPRALKRCRHVNYSRDAWRLHRKALNRLILARGVSIHTVAQATCVLLNRLHRQYVNDRLFRHQNSHIARGLRAAMETTPRLQCLPPAPVKEDKTQAVLGRLCAPGASMKTGMGSSTQPTGAHGAQECSCVHEVTASPMRCETPASLARRLGRIFGCAGPFLRAQEPRQCSYALR